MGKEKKVIKIAGKVVKETTKCEKDFACLKDNNHGLCKIVRTVQDNIIFIECLNWKLCTYRMSFGASSYICNCPTRKEIYRKYGK
jgi:hypothetical protein